MIPNDLNGDLNSGINNDLMNRQAEINSHESDLQQFLEKAWAFVFKHDISNALAFAQQAANISPNSAEVAHLLGLLASRDGRSDIALPLLQKALNAQVTQRRLRDMAEALLIANQPQAALAPINDAIRLFDESPETLGLLSAVQVALEDFKNAKINAARAIALKPHLMAWDSNLGFCELVEGNTFAGFKALSGRAENLAVESRIPTLQFAAPCDIWLKNEQGPGDTIFNLRYAETLFKKGFKLHIQTDKKTKTLLRETGIFASVKETFNCPRDGFWFNVGDLPLAALQLNAHEIGQEVGQEIVPPLSFKPEAVRVKKIREKLEKFGPAPYVAVTWRAGPRGKKQRNGLRMFNKNIPLEALGKTLSGFKGTVISVQRVPEADENSAFEQALGRPFLNLSTLNDALQDMLALLSIVDEYIAVPNTNVHLRASLGLSSVVFVNRPFQDWRWQVQGDASVWYPNTFIYRQSAAGDWAASFELFNQRLLQQYADYQVKKKNDLVQTDALSQKALPNKINHNALNEVAISSKESALNSQLKEGWAAVDDHKIAQAVNIAQAVLTAQKDYPPALNLLGWAAYRDSKIEIALGVLQQAANLAPDNGKILGDFIRVLTANKAFTPALNLANQALQNPNLKNKAAVFYARAAVNTQLNQLLAARDDYEDCLKISPNSLDALCYNGMVRLKLGDALMGFKYYSARPEARLDSRAEGFVCPWLRGDVKNLKVLLKRDMGLGDELTYLRYLPWLTQAGVKVDYWSGHKLAPVLARMGYFNAVMSDQTPMPNAENYDLAIWVHELPVAVEALNAPEIAPPLPLLPQADLVKKWQAWLKKCGPAPYIGVTWRAGVAATGAATAFSKLAKAVDAENFANALSAINATFISLQRNVMIEEVSSFTRALNAPLHDAAGLTDDLEDLLALLSVLDENIGVSNTNMHLRAGLAINGNLSLEGLGSRVLVQTPGGDWRWGFEGNASPWFKNSQVYRQSLQGDWQPALAQLSQDLSKKYGNQQKAPLLNTQINIENLNTQQCIWLTAGQVIETATGKTADIGSAVNRVLGPVALLEQAGWPHQIVNERISEMMGGWGNATPQPEDIVIISKVFTAQGVKLAKDAKQRNAHVIVDFCDNFLNHAKRAQLQHDLIAVADQIICSNQEIAHAFSAVTNKKITVLADAPLLNLHEKVNQAWVEFFSSFKAPTSSTKLTTYGFTTYGKIKPLTAKNIMGEMPTGYTVFSACDRFYLREHGIALIASSALAQHNLHLHIVNPIKKDLLRLDQYKRVAHQLSGGKSNLTYSYELTDLSALTQDEIYTYYACSRFLIAPIFLNQNNCTLLITDVDAFFNQHLPEFEQVDIALFLRESLKGTIGGEEEGTKIAAGLLYLSQSSHSFAQEVAQTIYDAQNFEWFLDQKALHHIYKKNQQKYQFKNIDETILDWKFKENSYIWTGKGNRKHHNKIYIDKKQSLIDIFEKQLVSNQQVEKVSQPLAINPHFSSNIHKKIFWLTSGKIEKVGDLTTSTTASARYRVLLPMQGLQGLGWQSVILNEAILNSGNNGSENLPQQGDILVVSKVFSTDTLMRIKEAKARGAKIVVDHCDNFFWLKERGNFQKALCLLADLNTAATQTLADEIQKHTQKQALLVPDPVEMQRVLPTFNPSKRIQLLWFGHENNYRALAQVFDEFKFDDLKSDTDLDIELTIVTDLCEENLNHWQNLSLPCFTKRYIKWQPQLLQAEFARCDLVILPNQLDEYGKVKSANRLIEAMQAGKFVLANALPSYQAFSAFANIHASIKQGLLWALANPNLVLEKISAGQAYIQQHFANDVIAQRWQQTFLSLFESENVSHPPNTHRVWQEEPQGLEQEAAEIQKSKQPRFFDFFQATEAARILGIAHKNDAEILQKYTDQYPVKKIEKIKNIAVYTAIFGDYDTPPIIENVDATLDYILFTDNPKMAANAPWQVRLLPAIFEDPQVDARRVKVLSQQFLPEFAATVWIDGNFVLKNLDRAYIVDVLSRAPIALCKHQFRQCIYEEAFEILRRGIDAQTPVLKQLQYYQARNFPKNYGLHATGFLIRNHQDTSTIKLNMRWWEILAVNSKRDQLAFDYVRWESNLNVMSLPFNQRDNPLFFWGKNGSRTHASQIRRNDEQLTRAINQQEIGAEKAKMVVYEPIFDSWPKQFLLQLRALNKQLSKQNAGFSESMLYFSEVKNYQYAPPDPRKGATQRLLLAAIAESRKILQIGFDGGHNTLLMMHFSGAAVTIAAPQSNVESDIGAQWLVTNFDKRVICSEFDEANAMTLPFNLFDTIFIDASAFNEIEILGKVIDNVQKNTKILLICAENSAIKSSIECLISLKKVNIFRGISNQYFIALIKR